MYAFERNHILPVSTHFQKCGRKKTSHGAGSSAGWYSFDPPQLYRGQLHTSPLILLRGSSNEKHMLTWHDHGSFGRPRPGFCVRTDKEYLPTVWEAVYTQMGGDVLLATCRILGSQSTDAPCWAHGLMLTVMVRGDPTISQLDPPFKAFRVCSVPL